MYNLMYNCVLKYHNVQLENIEVNGKRFVPPPKVRLNEHNIVNFEHGILEMFKQTYTTQINSSPYAAMQGSFSKYYSIFNDRIQKFTMELNRVMIRTLSKNFKVTNLLWELTKIPGGSINASKLCNQIMSIIKSVQHFGGRCFDDAKSAFLKIIRFIFSIKLL